MKAGRFDIVIDSNMAIMVSTVSSKYNCSEKKQKLGTSWERENDDDDGNNNNDGGCFVYSLISETVMQNLQDFVQFIPYMKSNSSEEVKNGQGEDQYLSKISWNGSKMPTALLLLITLFIVHGEGHPSKQPWLSLFQNLVWNPIGRGPYCPFHLP